MENNLLNRRSFLKAATLTAGAVALAARAPIAKAANPDPVGTTQFKTTLLPRDETLYFDGLQWGSVLGWNPYSSNNNNAMALSQGENARVTMFETPYMYNMLDGKQYPLLADGDYTWNAARTELTFKIKAAAKWSDGTPVTAEDVAYTFATHIKYQTSVGGLTGYLAGITAVDGKTVLVKAKLNTSGKPVNPLLVTSYLSSLYVVQKAWTQKLEARSANADALKSDAALDAVGSGPYMPFLSDDTQVVLVRNDNYWGKDVSMWGKLPAPKYLSHILYASNDASLEAFKAGEVDVSQAYIANVQDLWLKDHLPVSTYMLEAPYGICASLPTAYFNLRSYGLNNVAVRKAIAMAVDYDMIIANAMTNQSPTFTQVPRSVMNPTPVEQALYDHEAVKDLQWTGNNIVAAKALLDAAGIVDTHGDGWRELNGRKLSYSAVCPMGWTDWQAAIDIVAAAGQLIGIEITAHYPDWSEYQAVFTNGNQTEYDIFMVWSQGSGPANPWSRVRQLMSSEFAGTEGNWDGNWGGYHNTRIDEIIAQIPNETDPQVLKNLYTEATAIYLTDVPSFTLMYRPQSFHTVNESVWTNFPTANDGLNIPPLDLTDGYSIAGMYQIALAKPYHLFLPALQRP